MQEYLQNIITHSLECIMVCLFNTWNQLKCPVTNQVNMFWWMNLWISIQVIELSINCDQCKHRIVLLFVSNNSVHLPNKIRCSA